MDYATVCVPKENEFPPLPKTSGNRVKGKTCWADRPEDENIDGVSDQLTDQTSSGKQAAMSAYDNMTLEELQKMFEGKNKTLEDNKKTIVSLTAQNSEIENDLPVLSGVIKFKKAQEAADKLKALAEDEEKQIAEAVRKIKEANADKVKTLQKEAEMLKLGNAKPALASVKAPEKNAKVAAPVKIEVKFDRQYATRFNTKCITYPAFKAITKEMLDSLPPTKVVFLRGKCYNVPKTLVTTFHKLLMNYEAQRSISKGFEVNFRTVNTTEIVSDILRNVAHKDIFTAILIGEYDDIKVKHVNYCGDENEFQFQIYAMLKHFVFDFFGVASE